jgi:hypothetical protein
MVTQGQDPSQDLLMEEIKDDVRRDQLLKFLKTYGNHLIFAVLFLFFGIAGWTYWESHQKKVLEKNSEIFEDILHLIEKKDVDGARSFFEKEKKTMNPGVKMLSLFLMSHYEKDLKKREDQIGVIHKEHAFDKRYRDYALLKSVMNDFDTSPPQQLLNRIEVLVAKPSVWSSLALELKGFLLMKDKKFHEAQKIFLKISKDATASPSLQERALAMAQVCQDIRS